MLFAAALCALAGGAKAQSLVELYDSARGYDASFQGVRAQFDAAAFRADQARAGLLPSAGLTAGVSRSNFENTTPPVDRDYGTRNVGVSAAQPLYRPANSALYEQAKKQVDVARAQLALAEQDLLVRLSQAYFDVLAAQDTLTFVRAQKEAVAEQLAFAKRNFEVGTATITDSREAQARFDLVRAQEIASLNDLRVKRAALDQLVGRSDVHPNPLILPAALPALLPADPGAWVALSERSHPAIAQARLALDVARLETDKAEAGHKPTLDAVASYGVTRNDGGNNISTASSRVNVATIGLSLNWPLFAGFATQNRIRETLSLEEKARADLDFATRNVAQNTRTAYFGVLSGLGQVDALEAAEMSSQSALEANKLGYLVGVRINIDVLNAQSQLFQTKRDLAQARYNVLLGGLRLRQASGVLGVDDLTAVNALMSK
ncbi:MAG: TolC family outer membrane protein [Burkholderiales bacterium]